MMCYYLNVQYKAKGLKWYGYFDRRVISGFGPGNVNPDDNYYYYVCEEAGEEKGQGKWKWKNKVMAR